VTPCRAGLWPKATLDEEPQQLGGEVDSEATAPEERRQRASKVTESHRRALIPTGRRRLHPSVARAPIRYGRSVCAALNRVGWFRCAPLSAVTEIQLNGARWRGACRGDVGVFKHANGCTYAGGVKAGMADGHGVIKWPNGATASVQLVAGMYHGYTEYHYASGGVLYSQYERGNRVHYARVYADGSCEFEFKVCAAGHAGLVALKAAVRSLAVSPSQPMQHAPRPRPRCVAAPMQVHAFLLGACCVLRD
jgi:hypothetical protein